MKDNQSMIYFNTAACGIVPESVFREGIELYEQFQNNASFGAELWRDKKKQNIQNVIAEFIGAQPDEIAMIPNFSFGMNSLVQSLNSSEKILLFKKDYPSLLAPFLINQFDITWIDTSDEFNINLAEIDRIIEKKHIDIVAISHIQWLSGFKVNLKKISNCCKINEVKLIVDATQSLGAVPINVHSLDVDVMISSNYKWMNAGFGSGIMYIKKDFFKKYPPVIGGVDSYFFQDSQILHRPSMSNYEPGHLNMFGFTLLNAAIQQKNKMSLVAIADYNKNLIQTFLEGIDDLPITLIGPRTFTEERSSIVFLKDQKGLGQWLRQKGIITTLRNGNIRISFHYYNTEKEVHQLLLFLKEWVSTFRI